MKIGYGRVQAIQPKRGENLRSAPASPDCPACGRAMLDILGSFVCPFRTCRRLAREARERLRTADSKE